MSRARRLPTRFAAFVILLASALAAAGVAPARAQPVFEPRSEFAAGEAAFAAGDYSAALEAFQRARDLGADGAAVHYNIGVCQYRLGDYPGAAETFRAIAERFPPMRDLADYNLGLALVELNRTASARAAFSRALDSEDDKIARLAAAMLGRLGPRAAPRSRSLVALVDVAAGRDDNVALLDELSLPADAIVESQFLEAVGYVDLPLGDTQRLGVEATLYAVDYRDASRYDQAALRGRFNYRVLAAEARSVTLGPYYERSHLGGDGFEERFGLEIDFAQRVGARGVFSVRLGLADVGELDALYAYLAGDQQRARFDYRRPLAGGALTARYEREENDRVSAAVSPTRDRITLRWRRRIGANWEARLGLRHRESSYDDLAEPRTEKLDELRVELARDVGRGWELAGTLRASDNESTDPVYAYERDVVSLGLRKTF